MDLCARSGQNNSQTDTSIQGGSQYLLTEGYAPLAIASAIHKIAIDDGRYSSECMGVGMNYEKIYKCVYNVVIAKSKINKQYIM